MVDPDLSREKFLERLATRASCRTELGARWWLSPLDSPWPSFGLSRMNRLPESNRDAPVLSAPACLALSAFLNLLRLQFAEALPVS